MFCSNCGNKIADMDNFCSKCGTKIKQMVVNESNNQALSTNSAPAKRAKKPLKIGCMVLIGLFVLSLILSTIFAIQNADDIGATPEGKLAKELEITVEEAEKVLEIFTALGIDNYVSIEHDELLDNAHFEGEKGYRLSTRDVSNVILYMNNGKVYNIRYADNDLYKDGKVLSKINDYIVSNEEATTLQIKSQEVIKSILKAPSTAKFPNIFEWRFAKQDGVIIVQSYVDAQNEFGAMLRSEFQIKFKDDQIISLIVDGKEYIQQ